MSDCRLWFVLPATFRLGGRVAEQVSEPPEPPDREAGKAIPASKFNAAPVFRRFDFLKRVCGLEERAGA